MIDLRKGDCIEVMKGMADNSVDSIVTDPPYELGFMGKSWDSTGIANNVDMWGECLRVLKPGGYLLSFSATRTYHRMAVAIEEAGFEIRDMIEWVYGSGFPKSHDVGKAVDKLLGNEREVVGKTNSKGIRSGANHIVGDNYKCDGYDLTKGTSAFEGYGSALKPAHEPICMARKPLSESTIAKNCLKWGTGAINIDKSRVGTEEITTQGGDKFKGDGIYNKYATCEETTHIGRFPANLIHDNSEEVRECFPETKSTQRKNPSDTISKPNIDFGGGWKSADNEYNDAGNASRFFKSIIYQPKASKAERNKGVNNFHTTVKPVKLMEYLIEMVTPENGTVLDPFMGSGTTGVACVNTNRSFIGIEMDDKYFKIAEKRINKAIKDKQSQIF